MLRLRWDGWAVAECASVAVLLAELVLQTAAIGLLPWLASPTHVFRVVATALCGASLFHPSGGTPTRLPLFDLALLSIGVLTGDRSQAPSASRAACCSCG